MFFWTEIRGGASAMALALLLPAASFAVSGYAVSTMNPAGSLQYYGIAKGEIWRHAIQNDAVIDHVKLVGGNASRPAINPSGTHVAFVRGDGKICLVSIDGGAIIELADGNANSIIDFPHDDWVYFTMGSYHDHDSRILKRAATSGAGVQDVQEFGWRVAQIQISNDLSRAVMRTGDSDGSETGTIIAYDMATGNYRDVGGGSAWSCGSGFFADGQHLMDGHEDPHEEMDIRKWDGSLVKTFHNSDAASWPPNNGAAEPSSWNHSIFHTGGSTNSPDWLCLAMGGNRNYASDEQVLINWRDERCIVTTADLTGPTDHGDFWIGEIAASPAGQVSIEDDVTDQGQACFKITTPTAAYYYHKEGMGFSSIVDKDGNDWISYQPGGGAGGEYRGIPNMGWQFHPGYTKGGSSWIISQSDAEVVIGSKSQDGAWECRWAFYATHAQMTLVKQSGSYWFLYEGTPGGGPNIEAASDWWMMSDGTKKTCDKNQDGDIPGPEWICFGDADLNRVLLLCHHEDDNHPDKYYQMENKMTVFGFGRNGMTTYMDYAPAHFSIALYEQTDHASITGFARMLMGESQSPALGFVPANPHFTTKAGENPPPQAVSVTNTGAGTLDAVSAAISYESGEGWLSVTPGGEGNQQTLAHEVTVSDLAAGDYAATVTVTAANADPSRARYTVSLAVTDSASLNTWSDDFSNGNANGWTVGEGAWAVSDAAYGNTESGPRESYSAWAGSDDWTDIDYRVDITPTSSSKDIWVIFRVQDAYNFYLYQLSSGDLYKQQEGEFIKIKDGDSPGYEKDQTCRIRVALEGSSITVYSDELQILTHEDASFEAGPIGVGGYRSTVIVDNVTVTHQSTATAIELYMGALKTGRIRGTLNGSRLHVTATGDLVAAADILDSRGRIVGQCTAGKDGIASFDAERLTQGWYIVRARLRHSNKPAVTQVIIMQ